jgi:hypothetical protein
MNLTTDPGIHHHILTMYGGLVFSFLSDAFVGDFCWLDYPRHLSLVQCIQNCGYWPRYHCQRSSALDQPEGAAAGTTAKELTHCYSFDNLWCLQSDRFQHQNSVDTRKSIHITVYHGYHGLQWKLMLIHAGITLKDVAIKIWSKSSKREKQRPWNITIMQVSTHEFAFSH